MANLLSPNVSAGDGISEAESSMCTIIWSVYVNRHDQGAIFSSHSEWDPLLRVDFDVLTFGPSSNALILGSLRD